MIPIPAAVVRWLVGLLVAVGLLTVAWFHGRAKGVASERAVWTERQIVAERAARQTETDLAALAAKSAARQAQKEALLNDQANRQTAAWRAAMARVRDIRVPAAVGVQLDAAAGVSAAPAVARPPGPDPDDPALDQLVRLADELDTVRVNYAICRANIERLTEARAWYENVRERVNSKR